MGVLRSIQDLSFYLENTPMLPQQKQVFLFACVQLSQNRSIRNRRPSVINLLPTYPPALQSSDKTRTMRKFHTPVVLGQASTSWEGKYCRGVATCGFKYRHCNGTWLSRRVYPR